MGAHHYNQPGVRTGRRPVPDDFAALAMSIGNKQICKQWRCDGGTARRWVQEQPPEWQAARTEIMKARMRTAALRVQALGAEALRRKGEASRAAKSPKLPRAMPDDFETVAADLGFDGLMRHYIASPSTISRWLRAMPQGWRDARSTVLDARVAASRIAVGQRRKAEAAARREARAAERKVIQDRLRAERAAAKAEAAALKALAEPKTPHERVRAAGRTGPAKFRMKPMSALVRGEALGEASLAATFLRRRIPQVYNERKAITGDKWGDTWVVDTVRMSTDEMIEKARAGGFDPHGWRTVIPAAGEGARA